MKKHLDNKRKQNFTVKLDPDLIRKIKRKSVDSNRTIEVVVAEIFEAHFRRPVKESREPFDQASA